jgi:hypothetical protein
MKTNLERQEVIDSLRQNKEISEEAKNYRQKYMQISEVNIPRKLFSYLKSNKELEIIEDQFLNITSAVQKLSKYVLFENNFELLKLIGRQGIDVEALAKRNQETLFSYGRIDTALENSRFKLFEINSRRPQMFEDADWFSKMLEPRLTNGSFEKEENANGIVKTISNHFNANSKSELESIILISNQVKRETSFSFINSLENHFGKERITIIHANDLGKLYEELELRDNILFYKEKKVSLIIIQNLGAKHSFYLRDGAIRNHKIAEAYHARSLELFTSPAGLISGNKVLLEVLQNKEIEEKIKLTFEEKAAIADLLPQSFYPTDPIVSTLNHKEYVLKVVGVGSGQGIILGSEVTEQEWHKKIRLLQAAGKHFLVQKRVHFTSDIIFDLDNLEEKEAYITLEPIVVKDLADLTKARISGFSCRAIPVELYEPALKFNPAYNREEIYFGNCIGFNE